MVFQALPFSLCTSSPGLAHHLSVLCCPPTTPSQHSPASPGSLREYAGGRSAPTVPLPSLFRPQCSSHTLRRPFPSRLQSIPL